MRGLDVPGRPPLKCDPTPSFPSGWLVGWLADDMAGRSRLGAGKLTWMVAAWLNRASAVLKTYQGGSHVVLGLIQL